MMGLRIIGPDDPALEVLRTALEQNSDLNMELVTIPWAAYRDTLMENLQAESSTAHAVFVPGHIWLPELADAGYLVPMEQLFGSTSQELVRAYDPEDIVPEVASECLYRGQQFQLPFFTDGHLLFYRSDVVMLDDGNSVPIVSTSILGELARTSHRPPHHYGLALKADVSEIFTDFLPYLWEAGGTLFDTQDNPCFDSPANIEALKTYCALREWCPPDTDSYGNAEIATVLREGTATLVHNWGGQTAPILLDIHNPWRTNYKVAVPTIPWNATWGIAIPRNQIPQTQQDAFDTLMRLLSPQQDREITRQAGSPVRESSYAPDELARYPWLSSQREMLRRARPLPSNPKLGKYLGGLYEAVHQAFTGQLSPEEALRDIQSRSRL